MTCLELVVRLPKPNYKRKHPKEMYNTFGDGAFRYQVEFWKPPSEICSKSQFETLRIGLLLKAKQPTQ
jgi:hypothetical protein